MLELDAVNDCLRAITVAPVTSISSAVPESVKAQTKVDQVTIRVLTYGWEGFTTGTAFASITSETLQRYIAARAAREFQQESLGAETVDKFLVDREQDAYGSVLTAVSSLADSLKPTKRDEVTQRVLEYGWDTYTTATPFTSLVTTLQHYIIARTAREFNQDFMGAPTVPRGDVDKMLADREQAAYGAILSAIASSANNLKPQKLDEVAIKVLTYGWDGYTTATPYSSLAPPLQEYILARATREFNEDFMGAPTVDKGAIDKMLADREQLIYGNLLSAIASAANTLKPQKLDEVAVKVLAYGWTGLTTTTPYSSLPLPLQQYILARATREFNQDFMGAPTVDKAGLDKTLADREQATYGTLIASIGSSGAGAVRCQKIDDVTTEVLSYGWDSIPVGTAYSSLPVVLQRYIAARGAREFVQDFLGAPTVDHAALDKTFADREQLAYGSLLSAIAASATTLKPQKLDEVTVKVLSYGWDGYTTATPYSSLAAPLQQYILARATREFNQDFLGAPTVDHTGLGKELADREQATYGNLLASIGSVSAASAVRCSKIDDVTEKVLAYGWTGFTLTSPFSTLPAPLQHYIAARAAREFNQDFLGAPTVDHAGLDKELADREQAAYGTLVAAIGSTDQTTVKPLKLDDVTAKVLERGWSCNTNYGVVLTADVNGKVAVPAGTLSISAESYNTQIRRISMRLDTADSTFRLWDTKNNTFVWDTTQFDTFDETSGQVVGIKVDVIFNIVFTDLPTALQRYIWICGAKEFHEDFLGAPTVGKPDLDKMLTMREQQAWDALIADETDEENYNLLEQNDYVNMITSRNNFYSGL